MATTVQTPATKPTAKRIPMSSTRKTALVAGIFYLITFISIPTLALYGPIKNHRDWILGSGSHTAVLVGAFLEVIVALAGGTTLAGAPALDALPAREPGRTARSPHQSPHVVMRPHHIPFYLSDISERTDRRLRSIQPSNS